MVAQVHYMFTKPSWEKIQLIEFQIGLLIVIVLLTVAVIRLTISETIREKINAWGRRIHRALMEGGGFFKV